MINLKTVIYADVLVIVNFIVNYLLLKACAVISGHTYKTRHMIISAFIGGLYSLFIFAENTSLLLNFLTKIIALSVMVITAFGIRNIKAFLRSCAAFFLVNFAFAGIMLAVCTFISPDAAIYKNGIVYFDISIFTLTVGATLCYTVIGIISRFTKSKTPQKSIYTIRIHCGEKSAECRALFDSGNTLCDCFSGRPVIIAENDLVRSLCDDDLTTMKNFRLIPFSTIKDSGALPAFLADKTEIFINGKWIESKEIYIAATNKKIVSGEYCALFGVPYLETAENCVEGRIMTV